MPYALHRASIRRPHPLAELCLGYIPYPCAAAARLLSHESKTILAHGEYINVVESTLGRFEGDIIRLIEQHNVGFVYFTGHSLGGGVANVAHLVVRAQLMKEGSPTSDEPSFAGKELTCLAYTFAAQQTIVRLYEETGGEVPRLIRDLDASSHNVVYGCDPIPRLPGMLKYVDGIVTNISMQMADQVTSDPPPGVNDMFANMCVGIFAWELVAAISQLGPMKLPSLVLGSIKLAATLVSVAAKETRVMCQFTHLGTVVYKEPGAGKWEHFTTTAEIKEKLNVSGEELSGLLARSYPNRCRTRSGSAPNENDLMNALHDAHKYYEKVSCPSSSSSSSSAPKKKRRTQEEEQQSKRR